MATYTDTNKIKIFSDIDQLSDSYKTTGVHILDFLPFYQYKTIKMCEFYSNSKFLKNKTVDGGNFNGSIDAGNLDEMGREKPFYNIVNYRVTLAKVATDISVKDIRIQGDHPKFWVKAMFLQREAYKWMTDKDVNFGYFLNKAGLTRPKYGGVLVKKTETEDGKLLLEVVDWRLVVTDQVDILGGTIIEDHWMTPIELSKMAEKGWDKEQIKEAIKTQAAKNRSTRGRNVNYDTFNSDRIRVREVHGEFPVSYLKQAIKYQASEKPSYRSEDQWRFSRQRYYLAEIGDKCFVFDADTEKELPYDYIPWEEMPGRGLGRGVIEDSEEAQVWTNDAVINEKNAMDLAGRVVAKTTDKKLGNNLLTVDNGKIFYVEENKDLTILKMEPAALGKFQEQINKWQQQANYATSSFDANTGEQPPANTPYSQTALLSQIAERPFDFRKEEMGIFISRLFDKWVIPYLVDRLYKGHVLTSEFSDEELAIIDNSFAIEQANRHTIDYVINTGNVPSPEEYSGVVNHFKSKMHGNKRAIVFPDGYFDDIEYNTTVIVTNEQKQKAAMLQSLSQVLKDVTASYNPQTGKFLVLENPVLSKIFGSIVEMAGIDIGPTQLGIDANQQQEASQGPTPQQEAPAVPTGIVTPQAAPIPARQPLIKP